MKTVGSVLQRNVFAKSAVIGTLLVLALSSMMFISASAATYKVSLALSPTSSSYAPGKQPSETLKATNHGSATFDAKTCMLKFTGPVKGTSNCQVHFSPFSVAPGKTFTHFYQSFFTIPQQTPKGTYHFTVTIGGTVNGAPFTSEPGFFDITVT